MEGPACGKLFRGLIVQCAVGPVLIVVDPPVLDDPFCLGQVHEPVQVQPFFAEPAIETLDIGVLGRLARVNKVKLHTMIIGPTVKGEVVAR